MPSNIRLYLPALLRERNRRLEARRFEVISPMPQSNPAAVRAAILEVVENQLRDGTPPETRQTFQRLIAEGHSETEARRLIAVIVSIEIYDLLKHNRPYDKTRYVAALRRLPTLPYE